MKVFQPLLPLIEQASLLNTLPLSPVPRAERGLGGVGGAKRKASQNFTPTTVNSYKIVLN